MDTLINWIEFFNKFCKNVNSIVNLLKSSQGRKMSRNIDENVKPELDQPKKKKKENLLLYRIFDNI